jgi:putative spermidine/putrescine transport system permease protein
LSHAARRLALLLGPGLVLVVLPFVAALVTLAAYSLHLGAGDAGGVSLDTWADVLGDGFTWRLIGDSLRLALMVTAMTLLIAWPTARSLTVIETPWIAGAAYIVIFAPLLMSVIVRSYGWLLLLADHGFVNSLLGALGLGPYRLVQNEIGVVVAMVHILLPFAVLPLVSVLRRIPDSYTEAAVGLGASRLAVIRDVVLPLSLPGVIVAAEIVFSLSVSSFVTPAVLGGGRVQVLARLVYDNIGGMEWGVAAVQALLLLGVTVAALSLLRRADRATHAARPA